MIQDFENCSWISQEQHASQWQRRALCLIRVLPPPANPVTLTFQFVSADQYGLKRANHGIFTFRRDVIHGKYLLTPRRGSPSYSPQVGRPQGLSFPLLIRFLKTSLDSKTSACGVIPLMGSVQFAFHFLRAVLEHIGFYQPRNDDRNANDDEKSFNVVS
jgi:hypothetical protein